MKSQTYIIAPQAPLEESATTEASRRCSLNGILTGIRRSFWGRGFEPSASGICVLTVQNMVPELLRIASILSVCVSSFCSHFLQATFWSDSGQNSFVISEKKIT